VSEENESELQSAAKARVERIVLSGKGFLKRQSAIVLWTSVLLLVVLAFPRVHDLVANKQVVLLTGPEGGLYRELGYEIEGEFNEQPPWQFWGRSFSVRSQGTHGDEENREIIAGDSSGRFLGFAQDGFNPSPNIRSVLYLYDEPLHIVVREDFYSRATAKAKPTIGPGAAAEPANDAPDQPEHAAKPVRYFSDIAAALRSGDSGARVFLGMDKSGTRETAGVVLDHYDIDPDSIETSRDYDLKAAAYALIDGTLDVAFFSSQHGAPILDILTEQEQQSRANRIGDANGGANKKSILTILSLDDIAGIQSMHPYLVEGSIPRHAYSSAKDFPDHDVKTVASRQALICSAKMTDADVFWLAQSIDACVREKFPNVPWAQEMSPKTATTNFRYPRHPGAEKFAKQEDPGIVAGMKYVIAVVLVPVALKSLNSFASFFWGLLISGRKRKPEPQVVGYEQFNADLDRLLAELEKQPPPIAADALAAFAARANELEKTITTSFKKHTITADQRDSLVRGLKNVRFELKELSAPVAKSEPVAAGAPEKEPIANDAATDPTALRRPKKP
jgi:TRAP-type uncharacterized transport system substrate-binding protein